MKVKQEDFMQLFGQWNTDSEGLESRWSEMRKKAIECSDDVGRVSYSELLTTARFAKSGDAIDAVGHNYGEKKVRNEFRSILKNIFDYSNVEACENMLDATYLEMCGRGSLDDTERYVRQSNFTTLSPVVIPQAMHLAQDIEKMVLNCIIYIACAKYDTENNIPSDMDLNNWALKLFEKQKQNLIDMGSVLCEAPSMIHSDHSVLAEALAQIIFSNMPQNIMGIKPSLLECSDMLPNEIMDFGRNYGMVCAAFSIATSIAVISYDDFLKSIVTSTHQQPLAVNSEEITDVEKFRGN